MSTLEKAQAEESGAKKELQAELEKKSLGLEHHGEVTSVQSSQKQFLLLKGVSCWSLLSASEAIVSVKTTAGSLNSTSILNIDFSQKEINVNFGYKPVVSKGELPTFHGPIAGFMSAQMRQVANYISDSPIGDTSKIGEKVQHYAWSAGRIDQTAGELEHLLRRHSAKLLRTGNFSFTFSVEFESRSTKLTAEFPIELSYPSLPLGVKFDVWKGSIDVKALRKNLVKTTTPGFGSLSRVCDIIGEHVRSTDRNPPNAGM